MAGSDLALRICPVWHMRDALVSRYDPATASYCSMPPYLRYLAKIDMLALGRMPRSDYISNCRSVGARNAT